MASSDCSNCEKDFCDCVKDFMRQAKKASKTRSANNVLKSLKVAGINYSETRVKNIVLIRLIEKNDVYLSLIKDKSNGHYRFRIAGTANWETCPASKFIGACLNQSNDNKKSYSLTE
jgi:hypothetical protein